MKSGGRNPIIFEFVVPVALADFSACCGLEIGSDRGDGMEERQLGEP